MEKVQYLPMEIMNDILSRLNVKSIMRFRCVCKSWRDLIRRPDFIRMHSEAHMNDSSSYIIGQLLTHSSTNFVTHYLLCWDKSYDAHSKVRLRNYVLDFESYFRVNIHDSCNGLLCFSVLHHDRDLGRNFYLWNPSTVKLKVLAYNPLHVRWSSVHDSFVQNYAVGFGFTSKKNKTVFEEYKVVTIRPQRDSVRVGETLSSRAQVYMSSTKSWKSVDASDIVSIYIMDWSNKALVKGAIHWLGYRKIENNYLAEEIILSFDLEEEVFHTMKSPNSSVEDRYVFYKKCIGNFKGCLALARCSNMYAQIWVMMEYGVSDSWIQLFKFELNNVTARPICFGNNGLLMKFFNPSKVCLINFEEHELRVLGELDAFGGVSFTESLILLDEHDDLDTTC